MQFSRLFSLQMRQLIYNFSFYNFAISIQKLTETDMKHPKMKLFPFQKERNKLQRHA